HRLLRRRRKNFFEERDAVTDRRERHRHVLGAASGSRLARGDGIRGQAELALEPREQRERLVVPVDGADDLLVPERQHRSEPAPAASGRPRKGGPGGAGRAPEAEQPAAAATLRRAGARDHRAACTAALLSSPRVPCIAGAPERPSVYNAASSRLPLASTTEPT